MMQGKIKLRKLNSGERSQLSFLAVIWVALVLMAIATMAVQAYSSNPQMRVLPPTDSGQKPSDQTPATDITQKVFVGFRSTPGAQERALMSAHGGKIRYEFPEVNAFAIDIPASAEAGLSRNPQVLYVEEDPIRYPLGLADSELEPSMTNGLYGLITTKAIDVHKRGVTGAGISACIADTGIDYNHPDIAPRYKGGIDTFSNDPDPFWSNDPRETHGTHVAGTMLGALTTQGVRGVAYNANLYVARVLGPLPDGSVGGSTSDIIAGVRHLVEVRGCKVVSLSLGGPTRSGTEERFYKNMYSKGALIVAATGNDGLNRLLYPAGYAVVLAVGAVDKNNFHASFSNTGRNTDLSAPGVLVLSSVPSGTGSESWVITSQTFSAFGLEFAGKTDGIVGTVVNAGTGNTAAEFPTEVAGNIALMRRGDATFATKVTNAMNAGAVAAIIYNNVAGDFSGTLGSATTSDGRPWIPAVSVSDTAGANLKSQVGTSATVVNKVSNWDHYDGTSMATPHVSGVAALVWSVNPKLTNVQVENILKTTATDLGAAGFDTTYGYGLVNADAAVVKAQSG